MSDSFATRDTLAVNGKTYAYYSLPKLGQRFDIKRLPYSMKILLENLLRCEDGVTVNRGHRGGGEVEAEEGA
jgi:aconitate hydratase